jgi:hypothetical protein
MSNNRSVLARSDFDHNSINTHGIRAVTHARRRTRPGRQFWASGVPPSQARAPHAPPPK